jgi:hypothetical protein
MISDEGISFFLENGLEVGLIEKIPEGIHTYQYMPFRSLGHYTLASQIQAGHKVRCYVQTKEYRIDFLVKGIPAYGVLQVEISK